MRDQRRAARLRIHEMLDNIEHLREATASLTLEAYLKERFVQLATERAIEIISEASRPIPDDLKATSPNIPWGKVAGIGNVLRHDYRDVASKIIWNLIQQDLAPLEAAHRKMLSVLDGEQKVRVHRPLDQ